MEIFHGQINKKIVMTSLIGLSMYIGTASPVESAFQATDETRPAYGEGFVEMISGQEYEFSMETGKFEAKVLDIYVPESQSSDHTDPLAVERKNNFMEFEKPNFDKVGFANEKEQYNYQSFQHFYFHNYGKNLPGTYLDKLVNKDGTSSYINSIVTITDKDNNIQQLMIKHVGLVRVKEDLDHDDMKKYNDSLEDWATKQGDSVVWQTCWGDHFWKDGVLVGDYVELIGLQKIMKDTSIPKVDLTLETPPGTQIVYPAGGSGGSHSRDL